MARPATTITSPSPGRPPLEYEQPLNERMRTFMRLEFLYQQLLYNCEQEADFGNPCRNIERAGNHGDTGSRRCAQ
ncbi:MAG: hypothetical protein U5K38_01530 [Woeseiaceae bacterium]|nr:hypothetical protein [Woeseiaceae bacterium]